MFISNEALFERHFEENRLGFRLAYRALRLEHRMAAEKIRDERDRLEKLEKEDDPDCGRAVRLSIGTRTKPLCSARLFDSAVYAVQKSRTRSTFSGRDRLSFELKLRRVRKANRRLSEAKI